MERASFVIPASLSPAQSVGKKVGRRQDVLAVPGLFVVDDLLSEEECCSLVGSAKAVGFVGVENEFLPQDRNNTRLLHKDVALADALWQRLRLHFSDGDCLFLRPTGFGNEGFWRPTGLNACLKFGAYSKGQKFAPHFDGPWVPRNDECSIYTLVIYLNSLSSVAGGETYFFSDDGATLLYSVVPRVGRAAVFFHDTMHSGGEVSDGAAQKFVLRTEVMFSMMNPKECQKTNDQYVSLAGYKRMVTIYAASEDALRKGDISTYTAKYQEAIAIQRAQSRPATAQAFGKGRLPFPADVCRQIMGCLGLVDLLSCSLVSKQFREISQDNRLWEPLFYQYFIHADTLPDDAPPFFKMQRHLGNKRQTGVNQDENSLNSQSAHQEQEEPSTKNTFLVQLRTLFKTSSDNRGAYYSKFQREVNWIRNLSPILILDCNEVTVTIGVQKGRLKDGKCWDEQISSIKSYYYRQARGELHFRTIRHYYGDNCKSMEKEEDFLKSSFCKGGNPEPSQRAAGSTFLAYCRQRDAVVVIRKLGGWSEAVDASMAQIDDCVIFLDKAQLLLQYYKAPSPAETLIIEPLGPGCLLCFKAGLCKTVSSFGELDLFEPFNAVIYTGSLSCGLLFDLKAKRKELKGKRVLSVLKSDRENAAVLQALQLTRNVRILSENVKKT